ncbi:MAG: hypothetical protein JNN00_02395 [Chitinophagaceae bacterium]|nr:hypothetical protein [Chitinophagaceae bacterium]
MNKGVIACAVASIVITGPFTYKEPLNLTRQTTSITGKVSPPGEAEMVKIISGKDSLKIALVSGNFFAQVKPGKYKLIVNTKVRYKEVQLDNLVVKQNQALDVGEIILQ